MRGIRAKKINKLVINKNPAVLFSIRNKYGNKTTEMGNSQIYRAAKKIWTCNRKELIKQWK